MTADRAPIRTVLGPAALNRATLHRQLLLRRSPITALAAVRHLVGLQAQEAKAPYVGLWSRLDGFDRAALSALVHNRQVVRSSVLRGTQHLVAADDFLWLRPLIQPTLDRARQATWGRDLAGVDVAELAAEGRALLRGRTLTRPQLRDALAPRWPGKPPDALAWSVQSLVPVVHRPAAGEWGQGGATPFTLAEEWIGRPLSATPQPEALILRYLAGYGPATVKDVQSWSGVRGLAEVVDRLGPRLRSFADDAGRTLYDLPDAPRPDADTPAPVRFLPEYDNLLLAFADRTRMMTDEHRRRVCVGALVAPTFLVGGRVAGIWKIRTSDGRCTVTINPFDPLEGADRVALAEEALRMAAFIAPAAQHGVEVH